MHYTGAGNARQRFCRMILRTYLDVAALLAVHNEMQVSVRGLPESFSRSPASAVSGARAQTQANTRRRMD